MVDNLSNRYSGIPPHLRKIEELVSGTNTGKAPALATYYQHWEGLLFSALTSFVLASMRKLLAMFNPKHGASAVTVGHPLFQVWHLLGWPHHIKIVCPILAIFVFRLLHDVLLN